MLFDTHTHLDQSEFDDNRADVIARARAVGVTQLVAVGCSADESRKCVQLAGEFSGVYAAVGIQPNYVAAANRGDWAVIEQLATEPGVVAIGETGLDRHWDYTPFDQQLEFFDLHLKLAERHSLPFIVHMRDCDDDILQVLRTARQRGVLQGIMHSFTGDAEMAAECVALGMHISFAGMVTYRKLQSLRDCAATIPDERLLIETDSPYLSPEPVRGKRPNEPAYVRHTATCLAKVRGVSLEVLAALTTANARKLFGLAAV